MGNTYKKIELTGTLDTSIEDAVGIALEKASESVRNMRWFEITEVRGPDPEKKSDKLVVVDIEADYSPPVLQALRSVPGTIKARVLF